MRTVEINEKSWKNQVVIPTKSYKITNISLDNYPRVPSLISELVFVRYRQIGKESDLYIHKF